MTPPTSLQPLFKRVAQQDRRDDLLAVIATLSSKPLDTVYQQAETLGMPKVGPFYPWLDETLLGKLLAANNLKGAGVLVAVTLRSVANRDSPHRSNASTPATGNLAGLGAFFPRLRWPMSSKMFGRHSVAGMRFADAGVPPMLHRP